MATTRKSVNGCVTWEYISLRHKALAFLYRHLETKAIARTIGDGRQSPEDALANLMHWVNARVRPVPAGFPIIDDHPLNVLVRGYGTAGQAADLFTVLAAYKGYRATVVFSRRPPGPPYYRFAGVELDGAWRLFDVREGIAFRNEAGHLASVQELRTEPSMGASLPVPKEAHGMDYVSLFSSLLDVPARLRPLDQMPWPRLIQELRARCTRCGVT